MNVKKWFKSRKPWLRGGIIGVIVCVAIFLIYIFAYYPIISVIYEDSVPGGTIILPLITGHAFPLLTHFILESPSIPQFCQETELYCWHWQADMVPDCVPWTLDSGEVGCCIEQDMVPESSCTERVEGFAFLTFAFILLAVYFAIGAAIGNVKKKRRKK